MKKAWRLVITASIVVILVSAGAVAFIGRDQIFGVVGNIFSSVSEKLPFSLQDNTVRNISFSLYATAYPSLSLDVSDAVDVVVDSDYFQINTNIPLEIHTPVRIVGYRGSISIVDKNLSMKGSYEKIELSGLLIGNAGEIAESSTIFKSVLIEGLRQRSFELAQSTGELETASASIRLNGEKIELTSPRGDYFYGSNLTVKGLANRIVIYGDDTLSIVN
ncbi:MAG: hypothetical protein ABIG30_02295 [Candidatus Aenigmatarchaeota archaeon]